MTPHRDVKAWRCRQIPRRLVGTSHRRCSPFPEDEPPRGGRPRTRHSRPIREASSCRCSRLLECRLRGLGAGPAGVHRQSTRQPGPAPTLSPRRCVHTRRLHGGAAAAAVATKAEAGFFPRCMTPKWGSLGHNTGSVRMQRRSGSWHLSLSPCHR